MNYVLIAIGLFLIFLSYRKGSVLVESQMENQIDKNKMIFENNLVLQEYSNNLKYINEVLQELKVRVENIEISLLALNEDINAFKEVLSKFENNKDSKNDLLNFDKDTKTVDINEQIYEMTLQGLSIEEISSKLNIGKGEVLLRLGLIKAKK
ncbi:hypothetical protein SAMN05660865_00324 [Caloramator fervidus]|uniref:DUF2802 domain-containing protein n=1 Tax=Caloramator fervidus TaxID=29344 RepID=A0A1H5SCF2_9CLOT|nr:hypothetical protein [Caloramator fervidus]SEF47668.1 hypothetical protein SAMN05660865_00324 [Caloramator fervidus]